MKKIVPLLTLFLSLLLVNFAAAAEYWVNLDEARSAFTDKEYFANWLRLLNASINKEGGAYSDEGPQSKKYYDYLDELVLNGKVIYLPAGTVMKIIQRFDFDVDSNENNSRDIKRWNMIKFTVDGFPTIYYTYCTNKGQSETNFKKITQPPRPNPVLYVVKENNAEVFTYAIYCYGSYFQKKQDHERVSRLHLGGIKTRQIFSLPAGTPLIITETAQDGKIGLLPGNDKPYWIHMRDVEKLLK